MKPRRLCLGIPHEDLIVTPDTLVNRRLDCTLLAILTRPELLFRVLPKACLNKRHNTALPTFMVHLALAPRISKRPGDETPFHVEG